MSKLVVAIAGPICSGKRTLAEAFCTRHQDACTIQLSGILRDIMEEVELPTDRSSMSAFHRRMCDDLGADFLAKKALEEILQGSARIVLLDGWRTQELAEVFIACPETEFKGVYLAVPEDVLYARWVNRSRADDGDDLSRAGYSAQTGLDSEMEVPELLRLCNIVINGDQEPEEVLQKFEETLGRGLS